jgi:acyl-CoA synthetase (AMP-forming)/AMP-acid ligase II
VARGYLDGAPEAGQAFRHGGFYPGDLGRLREDGLLFIEGRVDDRMNLGGHKIMPGVVEEVAMGCPGVRDAVAFAAPDEAGVDQCWLAVVQGEGFERERLAAHLDQLRESVWPIRFAWTEAIPRNAMGKAERRRLRDETLAALGAA